MGSQFFTAVGAFVGTLLGIWIAETSGTGKGVVLKEGQGLFGSSVAGGDLVIPMTAGGERYSITSSSKLTFQASCISQALV
jgi:zinc transporter 7